MDWLNYTGFSVDVCVALFNVPLGNKDVVMPNPLMEEESLCVYYCDDERLSGSTKHWKYVKYLKCAAQNIDILIDCFTGQSFDLLGGSWQFKAAKVSRPSAGNLKDWLCKTSTTIFYIFHIP